MVDSIRKFIPWILVLFLTAHVYFDFDQVNSNENELVSSNSVLTEIEALGKLELVRYNFQEITEVERVAKRYLDLFKIDRNSKIILISKGEATACIDLSSINSDRIQIEEDTVRLFLPQPELCYFKIDLQKTRIYALETGFFIDEKEFIEDAYKHAENDLQQSALNSGILEQSNFQAERVLRPILEKLTGKPILFYRDNAIEFNLNDQIN
ncbi:MAG: DUF4230 domain-containing protein [Bacteroidota bacterium]